MVLNRTWRSPLSSRVIVFTEDVKSIVRHSAPPGCQWLRQSPICAKAKIALEVCKGRYRTVLGVCNDFLCTTILQLCAVDHPAYALGSEGEFLSLSGFMRVGLDQQRGYCRDELGRCERLAESGLYG
jgi:hypothetical protein